MVSRPSAANPPPLPSLLPVAVLLWLAGAYLRIPILVAPPLAPHISSDLNLSQALTGALTTLPILMLAAGSMPGSLSIARIGARNTLALAIVIMVIGSAARGIAPEAYTLLLASAVMGLGIAMMQPAFPALLPEWVAPHHLALGTAIYMNGMLMGEFIGAGVTLPLLMPLLDDSWRATLVAWSLPALLVAGALFLPRSQRKPAKKKAAWLPDWNNPLTLRIGLLLSVSGSIFFGLNAYMSALLEEQGQLGLLSQALFWYNLAQVAASLVMLRMARSWVGRRSLVIINATLCLAGTLAALFLDGWAFIACVTMVSFVAGILLILLVAVPPLVVSAEETGRLSAGTFLVGYTLAFLVPMLGGLVADWSGTPSHAILVMLAYGVVVLPLAFTLDMSRRPAPTC